MATNYLTQLNNDIDAIEHKSFTAAEKPIIDQFKTNLTRTVQQGHSPESLLNLTYLLAILSKRGLPLDMMQNQNELILYLGYKYQFNFQDSVIDTIVDEVKQAEREHRVFDRNLIHTIEF